MKCIILQVLQGLQYLHENYIIHRWEQQDGRGAAEPLDPHTRVLGASSTAGSPSGRGLVPISGSVRGREAVERGDSRLHSMVELPTSPGGALGREESCPQDGAERLLAAPPQGSEGVQPAHD